MAKATLEQKILYGALAALAVYFVVNMKKGKLPNLPAGQGPPAGTTLSLEKAREIAQEIKNSIGYTWDDVQRIDRALWALQNDADVQYLYNIFGNWDGPANANGDVFNVLNHVYSSYTPDNSSSANWTSIKNHMYGYGYRLVFS